MKIKLFPFEVVKETVFIIGVQFVIIAESRLTEVAIDYYVFHWIPCDFQL